MTAPRLMAAAPSTPPPDVSVLVLVVERPAPLAELYREFAVPLKAAGWTYEFVFATEPWWSDRTAALHELAAAGEPVRLVEVGQALGETSLLRVATSQFCRGRVIITLPAYRQVVAEALPALVRAVDTGADLAVARRWPRKDSFINRVQSNALHLIVNSAGDQRFRDVAGGVRAMRADLLRDLPVYGDFGRFLALLAARAGYRVVEVDAAVHPDAMGPRIYGPGVYFRRLIDIVGLLFLLRFTEKPLRFFGLLGGTVTLAGLVVLAVLLTERIAGRPLADRPLLLLGALLVTLGVQMFALGLIGEMIVHLTASRRRSYRLRSDTPDTPPPPA